MDTGDEFDAAISGTSWQRDSVAGSGPWEIDTEHPGRPAAGVPVSARAMRRWREPLRPVSAKSRPPALLLHLQGLGRG
jgi:hypothetical protein